MKKHTFQFSESAEHFFASLSRNLQLRILKKISHFESAKNPLSFSKKLQGSENLFRFRIRDYRLIVRPDKDDIMIVLVIVKIGHRRDVYE